MANDPLAARSLLVSDEVADSPSPSSSMIPADDDAMNSFQWPTEAANAMKIVVDPSQHSLPATTTTTSLAQQFAKLEYSATDRYLRLVASSRALDDDTSKRIILDTIDVDDMIGAGIEIALTNSSIQPEDPNVVVRASTSSSLYSSSNEPNRPEAIDTQACAVLHVYVYPRQERSQSGWWWGWHPCRSWWTTKQRTNPHPPRPTTDPPGARGMAERYYGPRHAQHRHWTLAAAEDLATAQTVVQALRALGSNQQQHRSCLLLVNPRSGPHKNAQQVAEQQVIPMLEQAGMDVTVCVTTHPGHAKERCQEEDVVNNYFDAIVTMGGDGILHEALNGLVKPMNGSDNKGCSSSSVSPMIRPAVGVIGCGTANGLAASLCWAAGETSDILTHTFLIAKGYTVPADLSEYTITPPTTNDKDNNKSDSKRYIALLSFAYGLIADCDIESECLHCLGAARFDVWGALCVIRFRSYRATFRYTTTTDKKDKGDIATWNTIQDDFVCFLVTQTSHAGETVYATPPKRFGDGVFHVMLIRRQHCSRYCLARILLGLETGRHVDLPGLEWITCTAYQWIPEDPMASFNDLDGEVVERGIVEARVLPQAVRYFGRRNEMASNVKQKHE